MLILSKTQNVIYRLAYFVALALGMGLGSVVLGKLWEYVPKILPGNDKLFVWLSLLPILFCLLSGYYIYYVEWFVFHRYTQITQINLKQLMLVFFEGLVIVLGVQSLVLAASWLTLV